MHAMKFHELNHRPDDENLKLNETNQKKYKQF